MDVRKAGWVALGVGGAVMLAAAAGYWTATGGFKDSTGAPIWLAERPIAHRGLHSGDWRVPENSMAAFRAAVAADYAIELDVQITSDGKLVVLHDEDLLAMSGDPRFVADLPASEVTSMPLLGGPETVPTLAQVLAMVDGRVPVFVDVKNPGKVGRLEDEVARELSEYDGPIAAMSFNPFSLERIARRAPSLPRGQLSGTFVGEDLPWWQKFLLGNLVLNFKSKPNFIGYQLEGLPSFGTDLQMRRGRPLLVWTADSPEKYATAESIGDAVIFELQGQPDW